MTDTILYTIVGFCIFASLIIAATVYPSLPSVMATHWGMSGAPNGFMHKEYAIFLMPLIMLIMLPLMMFLPRIDPLKANVATFKKEYNLIIAAVVVLFFALQSAVLAYNMGFIFDMGRVVLPAVGALFYIIGMTLPKTKRNWFIGIRTPWTLSSDAVWQQTHHVGGIVFRALGVLFAISAFLPHLFILIVIPATILAIIGVVAYSWWIAQKI